MPLTDFWPTLLDVPGFLQQFITPIVKVSKGKHSHSFFNLIEYENWLESSNGGKGYKIKYYKGLGTSTSAEAKEYFGNLASTHEISFAKISLDILENGGDDEEEGKEGGTLLSKVTSGSDMIDMVFRKDRVEERKVWLSAMDKDAFLDYGKVKEEEDGCVKYSDFINKELIVYSNYDNERSLPCLMDGLKPSQRKVLFGCIKRKLR